ncbi:enoyl-CoA hydratase-related protein [Humibacillus xanthopallidus]|uniref:Enoyl-CoA hydratase/carnithine racemase n=1 Tax=Humibacillus xanthopallidus TaxID=412689 RepID=A0A543HHR2_9MICO|nr:enoyl-CoA hydratase-related protein [Humibacillus xanthopallidus]TQM57866.1 enoyl-CoA hydratase/carnithine racemase [Humibacillus xanthopallidus]
MPALAQEGPTWTISFGDDENRFSPSFLNSVTEFLDDLASSSEPAVLLTTGGGKYYSNGLDLDWLGAHPDEMGAYVRDVQLLFAKILTLPVPTVAALNGHAFGAGAMLAMAHDYRVMREDRGYFCFPEVDIKIPFTPGMSALIMSKLSARAAVDAMTTGRRYSAAEALTAGLVDATAAFDDLVATASALVVDLAGKDRATLGKIKATMFADAVTALQSTES